MPTTPYSVYEIQLMDINRGRHLNAAGGKVLVVTAGGTKKVTTYDPDNFGAALTNPVTPTRGKIRFATLATVTSVDVYGIDAAGRAFVRKGVTPGDSEIFLDLDAVDQLLVLPFDITDTAAATETDTGIDLPAGALVTPFPWVYVSTLEASRTIEVGLLSGESGGDADGFIDAVSLAAAGTVKCLLSGTPTLGALLVQNFGTTPAVNIGQSAVISTAVSVTYTLSASTASAKGFFAIPYQRPLV